MVPLILCRHCQLVLFLNHILQQIERVTVASNSTRWSGCSLLWTETWPGTVYSSHCVFIASFSLLLFQIYLTWNQSLSCRLLFSIWSIFFVYLLCSCQLLATFLVCVSQLPLSFIHLSTGIRHCAFSCVQFFTLVIIWLCGSVHWSWINFVTGAREPA